MEEQKRTTPKNGCTFECCDDGRSWVGRIIMYIGHGDYVEMYVEGRSALTVIAGSSMNGTFICVPNFGVGCEGSDFGDTFYNMEKLIHAGLPRVDAITVAKALAAYQRENETARSNTKRKANEHECK